MAASQMHILSVCILRSLKNTFYKAGIKKKKGNKNIVKAFLKGGSSNTVSKITMPLKLKCWLVFF